MTVVSDIVEKVKAAGVVGAGGAGFPTHVKIAAKVDTVIANGAECDPLLTSDQRVMESHAPEVVAGLRLVMQASGAARGIIALKREYGRAVAALRRAISGDEKLSLHLMDSFYPAGDEFTLVHEVTGRLVPEAGLPLQVGCIVQNVGTLVNVALAQKSVPVTHRYVTVTGAVVEPRTFRLPIGTPIGEAITLAGGIRLPRWEADKSEDDFAVVVGGPMMGRLAGSMDEPITKTTGGLIVLPKDNVVVRYMSRPLQSWVRRGVSTCDQCRDCTTLCPRHLLGHYLQPHRVMRAVNYGLEHVPLDVTAAVLCCECRLCEAYACPLELSPLAYYREIKKQLQAEGWKNETHRRDDLAPHPFHDYRRIPTHRLVARLGLTEYEGYDCPLDERDYRPTRVAIPLRQHIGAPAEAVVGAGATVERGDLIGRIPEGKLGANVHASMAGKVEAVVDGQVTIHRQ